MSLPIDVFPAKQGFPRPPDGGAPAPTADGAKFPASQGFPPAPLVNPFPIEPTPPQKAFLPASQGVPPVPVLSSVIPPAQEVDTMDDLGPPTSAPTYVVTDLQSFPIIEQDAIQFYTVTSVTDYDTGLPPTAGSVNLRIVLGVGLFPLDSFGITFAGRALYFTFGAWIPPGTTPQRPVLVNGSALVVVPNRDADGNPFAWPAGPAPGDQVALVTSRQDSEVVFKNLGVVQNVVPDTSPLLPPPGTVTTEQPVQDVLVSDQATQIGTPQDIFPTNHHPV